MNNMEYIDVKIEEPNVYIFIGEYKFSTNINTIYIKLSNLKSVILNGLNFGNLFGFYIKSVFDDEIYIYIKYIIDEKSLITTIEDLSGNYDNTIILHTLKQEATNELINKLMEIFKESEVNV